MAIASRVDVAKSSIILQEGHICRHIYFVASGCLRTYTLADGTEVNTDFIFEGSFATNLRSLRTASASDTSIQAYEPSELYRFDGAALLALYATTPGAETLGRAIIEDVLIRQQEYANMFRLYTGRQRYQYLLATRPQVVQRISLSHIASYLGIARETLSRIRRP
jgi:CRP-like cAMP-binding protein